MRAITLSLLVSSLALCACRTEHSEGETCDNSAPGTDLHFRACENGLVCSYRTDPPSCQPPSEAGGFCSDDGECVDGLICNTSSEQCEAGKAGAEGDACGTDENCADPYLCYSATGGEFVCTARNQTAEGGTCWREDDECEAGQVCVICTVCAAGVCAPPAPSGGLCLGDDNDCEPGLVCIESPNLPDNDGDGMGGPQCMHLSGKGGPCFETYQCEAGLFCDAYQGHTCQ